MQRLSAAKPTSEYSIAEGLQALKLHAATIERPLVVLLEQHDANQARDGRGVREHTRNARSPLDHGNEPS
jgi:hypothetical protein